MSEIESYPGYKDLDPNDYMLTNVDYTVFEGCGNTPPDIPITPEEQEEYLHATLTYTENSDDYLKEQAKEAALKVVNILEFQNTCDRVGVSFIGEFLRHTCPSEDQYASLPYFAKQLTNEFHVLPHKVVETALKFSGCKKK